jgi:hypothetical protein
LLVAQRATFVVERGAPPELLQQAWAACEAAWSDQSAHDRAFALAASQENFAWLAGRYQEKRRQQPEDTIAETRLARLTRAAEVVLAASAAPKESHSSKRIVRVIAVVLAVTIVALTIYLGNRILHST